MADFYIYDTGSNWIVVDIPQYDGYTWYSVFVYDSRGSIYHDQWHYNNSGSSLQVEVTGLQPETEYTVEVSSATTSNGDDLVWLGSLVATTTSGTGGGGGTVPVTIDFNVTEIYRIRLYYDDGSGEYVSSGSMYETTTLYVAPGTALELATIRLQDGQYPPVQCTLPDGSTLEVMDENEEIINYPYVDNYGGTYYFYPGSGGGDEPDYGSFVERTVYFDGLEYVPFISDGGYWYQYRAFIAE